MADEVRHQGLYSSTLRQYTGDTYQTIAISKRGEQRMIDFITYMLLEGRGFQIRAGTIATGVAADSVLTDTAAEGCVDAASGTTIIPINLGLTFDDIATATTVKAAVKAVGVVSSAGTAQVPLPLLQGGDPSQCIARVANNGGVTVTAELATTTRRLWQYNSVSTQTPTTDTPPSAGSIASIAAGVADLNYIGKGAACVYVQVAATTAFPLYFFNLDYIELASVSV